MKAASWAWVLLGLLPGPASLAPYLAQEAYPPEAQRLRQRWADGQSGIVLALGDSLAYGLELDRPDVDSYPALLVAMLQTRFANPRLGLVNEGQPGRTAGSAWQEWRRRSPPQALDLVLLQFGGNDAGQGVPEDEYEASLRSLARRMRTFAPVLLIVPPMQYQGQQVYPEAARRVARAERLPFADFDRLLKTPPCDVRGPFPLGAHPREAAHRLMALEAYRVLATWMGEPRRLQIQPPGWDSAPSENEWRIAVGTSSHLPQQGSLRWRVGEHTGRWHFRLPSHGAWSSSLPLEWEEGERSAAQPVAVAAVTDGDADLGLGEVSRAPVYPLPMVAQAADLEAGNHQGGVVPWGSGRVFLASAPPTSGDLSVALRLADCPQELALMVQVRDDRLVTRRGLAAWQQDAVEIYLDLRPGRERGMPFFDSRCLVLFAVPTAQNVRWESLGQPAFELGQLGGRTQFLVDGYRLLLTLPWQALERVCGGRLQRFGLDVAVDDHDGFGREAQWVWCGDAKNYLNPARYAALERGRRSAGWEVRGFLWNVNGQYHAED